MTTRDAAIAADLLTLAGSVSAEVAKLDGIREHAREADAIAHATLYDSARLQLDRARTALMRAQRLMDPEQTDPEDHRDEAEHEGAYRERAREAFADDDCEIDADADVSLADRGAWVAAWLWLETEDEEEAHPDA